jgi:hypothetical protein
MLCLILLIKFSTVPLNISACNTKSDVKDQNQVYLKSACTLSNLLTYNQAEKACEGIGMELLNVQTDALKTAVDTTLAALNYEGSLHVKGRNFGGCQRINKNSKTLEVVTADCYTGVAALCEYKI